MIAQRMRVAVAILIGEFLLFGIGTFWALRYSWMAFWVFLGLCVVTAFATYLGEFRHLSAALACLRRQGDMAVEAREFLEIEGDLVLAQSLALVVDREVMVAWLEQFDPETVQPAPVNDAVLALIELTDHMRSQQDGLRAHGQAVLDSFDVTRAEVAAILSRRVSQRVKRRALQPGIAESLTSTAVRIAGGRHAHLHEPWRADLFGVPEEGITVSPRERLTMALGFVVAGLRLRLRDLAAPFWRPVDWLLSVDSRLNAFVTMAVGSAAVYFDVTEGLRALLVERSEACTILGGSLYGLARLIRRRRGIEVQAPRRRQT